MNLTPNEQLPAATGLPPLGAHPDIPFAEYLSWDAPSSHDLALIRRSPLHYTEAKINPPEPTPAMRFGAGCHALVLEGGPGLIHSSVAVAPKVDRRTKEGKAIHSAFLAESEGKTVIKEDEYFTIRQMAKAIEDSQAGAWALNAAPNREHSCLFEIDPGQEFSVICRGRPDAYGPKLIVDLKTCQDASAGEFGRSAARFEYHAQAAFYYDGLRSAGIVDEDATFVFLAVEKTAPFGVGVYAMTPNHLDAGRLLYQEALDTYVECQASGEWPSYVASLTIQPLSLPKWAMTQ